MEPAAEYVDPRSLVPWAQNPRHNDEAVPGVVESIRRFGFASPIIARRENREVVAGHTRLKAALSMGLELVPVRWTDLDADEAHALALADNKLTEAAEWDEETLAEVMAQLGDAGTPTTGLGWTSDELAALLNPPVADPQGDPDDAPEPPVEPVSRAGEVYELGPHRLLCGDSTDAGSWGRVLLDGERLQMVWTDPPYGVSYVGKTKDALTIENDDLDPDGLRKFLVTSLGAARDVCEAGSAWYIAGQDLPHFGLALHDIGVWRQTLVWVKDSFVLGRKDYNYRAEPIFYGWAPGGAHKWFGDGTADSVLEFPKPKRNGEHPTMKPVDLVRHCIRNSSKPGWLVGEPFGGSGTTLIASAIEGRIARVIELDPRYCDVIRRRWTKWARENNVDPGPGALDVADEAG